MSAQEKFKIVVIGIGGVGGFVGGKLAARFGASEKIEIVLAARGENEQAIRARGLKLITTEGEQIIKPKLAADPAEIVDADLLLLCTKGYGLEETILGLKDNIGERTAILPLLNGVDPADRIASLVPEADIWEGCIYIVSRLTAPGVVEENGNICSIYFGKDGEITEKQQFVEAVFREAGMDAHLTDEITVRMWEKFVFISALAAATSYLDARLGEVWSNPRHKSLLSELLAEIKQVARAKNIDVSEEALQQKLEKLSHLPKEATSSMHRDFSQGRPSELESLVGYVVREAKELKVPTPVYDKIYGELVEKQNAPAGG